MSADGDIIEGLEISGGIDVYSENVIIRNCRFIGTSDTAGIYFRAGSSGTVYNCSFVDMECAAAIQGDDWNAYANYVTGLPADAFKVGVRCWLWDNLVDGMVFVVGAHPDGVQVQDTVHGLSVVTGNWMDMTYTDGDHASSVLFSNPNFDNYPAEPVGTLLFVGNTLIGGGYPLYLGNGSLGTTKLHTVMATGNRVDNYEYADPILPGLTQPNAKQLFWANELFDGTPLSQESASKGTFRFDGDQLFIDYTAGSAGSVQLGGPVPADFA